VARDIDLASARKRFADLLGRVASSGAFSSRRTAGLDDLRLEVKGVGQIELPVPPAQAEQLRELARPARFGRGELTLLDPRVRDTHEIPKSRVKIDKRQWQRTLGPVLAGLASDLGVPKGCRLEAEFHAMLVYGPGQFFAPHQDSEKSDAMIGTLVVMLPSDARGGVLQIDHGGQTVSYRSSKTALTFVAFYADCLHQVKPVTSGHRVVLTYNLLLRGDTAMARLTEPALVDALAKTITEHFNTRVPARYGSRDEDPPTRLVFLLDHEYTERGLSWTRLKGTDTDRAGAVRAAAEAAGCEVVLALARVHEIWNAEETWQPRNRRRWSRYDDDEDNYLDPGGSAPEDYELTDLIDSNIELTHWLDESGRPAAASLVVRDSEVCASTPSAELTPYESQYEGYMGNYGNTMDRWYRRAALALWPRHLSFAIRAEGSAQWALDALAAQLKTGDIEGARTNAATLAPFWAPTVGQEPARGVVGKALRVSAGLDDRGLATMLLAPLRVEALTPTDGPMLDQLAAAYGHTWCRDIIGVWFNRPRSVPWSPNRATWALRLPALAEKAVAAAHLLVAATWAALSESLTNDLASNTPTYRDRDLAQAGPGVVAVLTAADTGLRDHVVTFLSQDNEHLIITLLATLRAAAKHPTRASGLDALVARCAAQLTARLARPPRGDEDWSVDSIQGCSCDLCTALNQFLNSPTRRVLEWPLAEPKRKHIHFTIDRAELPLRHETRRKGSPFTLVLTKTTAIFDRERDQHRRDQADLAWLETTYGIPPAAAVPTTTRRGASRK
jgi:hypothetical protein